MKRNSLTYSRALMLCVALLTSIEAKAGYDPTIGRWLNRDPINNAELLQGPNLYSYVQNDPVGSTDPLGLYAIPPIIAPPPPPPVIPVVAAGTLGWTAGTIIYNAAPDFWAQTLWGWLYDQSPQPLPARRKEPSCNSDKEKCIEECYEKYDDHCHNYCAKLPTPFQRLQCYEQAGVTRRICEANCN